MKFEKTENFKKVQETFKAFDEKGDMFFALFNIKNDGTAMFTGDEISLAEGIYHVLKGGLEKGCGEGQTAVSIAIISAFSRLLKEDSKEGLILAKTLNDLIKSDMEERIENIKEKADQMFKDGKGDDVIDAFFHAFKNIFGK